MSPSTTPPSNSAQTDPLHALIVGVVALVTVITAFSVVMAGAAS